MQKKKKTKEKEKKNRSTKQKIMIGGDTLFYVWVL